MKLHFAKLFNQHCVLDDNRFTPLPNLAGEQQATGKNLSCHNQGIERYDPESGATAHAIL